MKTAIKIIPAVAVLLLGLLAAPLRADILYVSNFGNSTVEKFNSGGVGSVFAHTLLGPLGLAFDSAGNLYVAESGANRIESFTPAGGLGSFLGILPLNDPTGLAFDSAGNLYVANDNAIVKFTPAGGLGTVFASGLSGPGFLEFTTDAGVPLRLANQAPAAQVPEPSTLAMLVLGLVSLFRTGRRRGRGA